jgi:hypothetical protein
MKEAKQAKASTTHSQGEAEGEADKTTFSNAQPPGGAIPQKGGSGLQQKGSSGLQSSSAAQNGSGLKDESPATDAISLLKSDHRKVEGLFAQFLSGSSEDKAELVKQVCSELIVHAMIEEEIFYPACRVAGVDDDDLDEAQVEHDSAKMLIHELLTSEPDEEYYDAQVKVLSEYIKHHVAEEENQKEGILAKAKQAGIDMNKLGQKLKARKAELMQRVARNELTIPVPRSFHSDPFAQHENTKEQRMDRYQNTPDRDERGRFVSDDDDDRGGRRNYSQSRGRDDDDDYRRSRSRSDDENGGRMRSRNDDDYERRSRSRNDDDYEDRRSSRGGGGRSGWSGDSEGHSEAARRGWETRRSEDDNDYRGRSHSRNDDDNRMRSRSRDDDDDRGRGRGGWFGDSRGHSEAARKGWENPQHGESGWYGDQRGHSEAARRGWENPQHGESGWFGDPEGHSEASRRGWEERGGRSSRGRYSDDDDRRHSRSR